MAPAAERRHRRGKGKGQKRRTKHRATTVHDLPDHILEQILLRLGPYSPYLVRAAATCRRWCHVVADAGFLAQLGPAPHLGDYRTVSGHLHVFVPSSQAEIPIDSHRLSLDFLPASGKSWNLVDSHGSLLLLLSRRKWASELVVCEPLTERYQGFMWSWDRDVFLLDGGADSRDSMSNFSLIMPFSETKAHVFDAGSDGGWHTVQSPATGFPAGALRSSNFVGRANGSLYWGIDEDSSAMFVVDEATVEFSITVFPESVWRGPFDKQTSRVIGGEDGVPRVVRLIGNDLKIFARLSPGGGDDDGWMLEKALSLREATIGLPGRKESLFQKGARIVVANTRYILLTPCRKTWLFSVEIDTMRVEREHERNKYAGAAYPYELPWPPVLPDRR